MEEMRRKTTNKKHPKTTASFVFDNLADILGKLELQIISFGKGKIYGCRCKIKIKLLGQSRTSKAEN
jgi:hypothetical protein